MLIEFVENLLRGKTEEYSWFEILRNNFIEQRPPEGIFIKDETYFEIVVHNIFLCNRREYWKEYCPLGVTLTHCTYSTSEEEIPFVIGPHLLGKLQQVREGDYISYRNIRVAGPQPYMGGWVNLFTGLWRSPTGDIAKEVISFAEIIGGAIQISQLGSCLAIAKPLAKGLETLLGMDRIDLRVGYLYGFSPRSGPNCFRPGYFAMIRAPRCKESEFWVKRNCLYFGNEKQSAEPYVGADYVLFSITCFKEREGIERFPFFEHWRYALKKVWERKDKDAETALNSFFRELAMSPDFTTYHRMELVRKYKRKLLKEITERDARALISEASSLASEASGLVSDRASEKRYEELIKKIQSLSGKYTRLSQTFDEFVNQTETKNATDLASNVSGIARDASGLVLNVSGLVSDVETKRTFKELVVKAHDIKWKANYLNSEAKKLADPAEASGLVSDASGLLGEAFGLLGEASGLVSD